MTDPAPAADQPLFAKDIAARRGVSERHARRILARLESTMGRSVVKKNGRRRYVTSNAVENARHSRPTELASIIERIDALEALARSLSHAVKRLEAVNAPLRLN